MDEGLFSPRVRRFGERLSLLIFFASGLWFLWRAGIAVSTGDHAATARPVLVSLGLAALCFLQFGTLLWVQWARRQRERMAHRSRQ